MLCMNVAAGGVLEHDLRAAMVEMISVMTRRIA
jgi:hypothetical protein